MAALTTYAKNRVLDKLLSDTGSFPSDWYYALFTTSQDTEEAATECTDTNYARQLMTFNAAVDGAITNDLAVLFSPMNAQQDILAVGLCDALSGGHVWLFENLIALTTVDVGQQARVVAGGQIITAV